MRKHLFNGEPSLHQWHTLGGGVEKTGEEENMFVGQRELHLQRQVKMIATDNLQRLKDAKDNQRTAEIKAIMPTFRDQPNPWSVLFEI
jgi:hypothetical protein